MKKALKAVLAVVIAIVLLIAAGIIYISSGLKSVGNEELSGINPTVLEDGTYSGKYGSGRWANEVMVKIEDGKIVKIEIVKDLKFAKEEVTGQLIDKVIEAQDTQIDAISGATVTCKAYLKSIENALKG